MKARIKAATAASLVATLSLAPQKAEALYVSDGWGSADYVDPMKSMRTFKEIRKDVRDRVRANKKDICDVPDDLNDASLAELVAQNECLSDLSRWRPSDDLIKKKMEAKARAVKYCHVRKDNFWNLVENRMLPLSESQIFEWEYEDETNLDAECALEPIDYLPSYERNSLDWQVTKAIVARQDQCVDDFVFDRLPDLVVNYVSEVGDEIKAPQ